MAVHLRASLYYGYKNDATTELDTELQGENLCWHPSHQRGRAACLPGLTGSLRATNAACSLHGPSQEGGRGAHGEGKSCSDGDRIWEGAVIFACE